MGSEQEIMQVVMTSPYNRLAWGTNLPSDVPTAIKPQLQQEGVHSPHGVGSGVHLEHPALVINEAVPLNPTEYLLHKITISSPGDVAIPPNT